MENARVMDEKQLFESPLLLYYHKITSYDSVKLCKLWLLGLFQAYLPWKI